MRTPFDRPLIVLSAPRSGSTLLFELLSNAPEAFTVGGESHRVIESIPALGVAAHGFDSNRLTQQDADPHVVARVWSNFVADLRDRDGRPPGRLPVRLLEKTPKNCLRLPFLLRVFPDARFAILRRRPEETLASMIDAWQSDRFTTYPFLPGWQGLPWSLLLVPGWRNLIGRPVEDIVAHQWATTMDTLLDDLRDVPRDRVVTVRYESLVAEPQAEAERVCRFAALGWDRRVESLPLSRHTLTPPRPDKWKRHEHAVARVLPRIRATIDRVDAYFGA